MATALKLRRGTTVQHSTFTGAEGEVTVDTTKDTLVVHDNATAGGFPVVTETGTQTLTNKTIAAVAGSAGSPSITVTGDTNTGIFFPAADTIAFSEGGTESMRIDSAGNMGIGVTPTTKLTVAGVGRYLSGTEGTQIGHNGTIGYIETAGNVSTPITFYNGGAEKMRIDASGNLGIGTASPSVKLHVAGTGTQSALVQSTNGGTTNLRLLSSTAVEWLVENSTGGLKFIQDATERMRITSAGGVSFGSSGTAYGTTGQVLTSNGNAAPTWTDGGSMTLLGTLTASGTSVTLSGLTLTSYKQLYIVFNAIKFPGPTTNPYMKIEGATVDLVVSNTIYRWGQVSIELISGAGNATTSMPSSTSTSTSPSQITTTGALYTTNANNTLLTTASTSVTFNPTSSGGMTSGTIYVYGVK